MLAQLWRDLEDAYGYEFDEAAWDSLDKKIDFDAKNPKNFRGAYDIVDEGIADWRIERNRCNT